MLPGTSDEIQKRVLVSSNDKNLEENFGFNAFSKKNSPSEEGGKIDAGFRGSSLMFDKFDHQANELKKWKTNDYEVKMAPTVTLKPLRANIQDVHITRAEILGEQRVSLSE
jgi:hypothetical protein